MFSYSKGASLLLAISVAMVTTAFLSLFETVPLIAILTNFFLSFGAVYILVHVALNFFIFREINKINKALEKLKKDDMTFLSEAPSKRPNPFQKINEEIYSYATVKQQEIEDLKKLAAFRREFLADVSHELKTPVFAAQGFVLTLLDGAVKDKTVRNKFLKKAAKSLEALELLLEDLLTISQMESGEIKMNFKEFNIIDVTREALEQFEEKAEKKNIKMIFNYQPIDKLMVYGDPRRIHQVMTNLISNAIKYSQDTGQVDIYFKELKEDVKISIKDNGIGIPPQDIKRIFERFYRVEKSRSKDKGGAGLGLAIVKHILEAHNTKVNVNSKLGEGSTFSFKLLKAAAREI
jgi:two-component system, OmpR family, phosphate regulon sensor histidine kinase PhoR